MKKIIVFLILFFVAKSNFAINMATPLAPIPAGRLTASASYEFDGITITDREIPSIMNRIMATGTISPTQYFNAGLDVGLSQIEVASDSTNTTIFHGKFSFSGGANIKLSTPFVKNIFGFIGIIKGGWYNSPENDGSRYYQGFDVAGVLGPIFHIPKFGYIALGPKMYYIHGDSKGAGTYHNINNLRGWIAIEYFPKMKDKIKMLPFITIEGSISPEASVKSNRAPIVEFGAALTFGGVSSKILGKSDKQYNWTP